MQCHFGDKDDIAGFSDAAAATELEGLLKQSGCDLEFYRYPTQVGPFFVQLLQESPYLILNMECLLPVFPFLLSRGTAS